ncbi:MAG: hypothetical protein ACRD38_11195 [Nitrososphaerales archaeon]
MGRIYITSGLRGSLGECYYKEYCAQKGWAYTSLEQIFKNKFKDGRLEFKLGFERILIHIPPEIKGEIETLSKPSNNSELNPSFVYDFLACKAWESKDPHIIDGAKAEDFRWVEVKTGGSELTPNQLETSERIKIPLVICRIPNVMAPPSYVNVYWNSVEEDLDRLDEDYDDYG